MLNFVLKKLLKNRWMTVCMLTGSILIIALLAGIPIYAQGVLQRVLIKDMEKIQADTQAYPGTMTVSTTFGSGKTAAKIQRQEKVINDLLDGVEKNYHLDVVGREFRRMSTRFIVYTDYDANESVDTKGINMVYKSGLEDHISLLRGRMPEKRSDGVVEVLMTSEAMADCRMILDKTYTIGMQKWLRMENDISLEIQVVGLITIKEEGDTYWSEGFDPYIRGAFTDEETLQTLIDAKATYLESSYWNILLDYYGIDLTNAARLANLYASDVEAVGRLEGAKIDWPVSTVLSGFGEKERELNFSLLVIELPVIILLAFYIFMVSQLVMEQEANEIAVLKSRGASRLHIFSIYLLEGVLISGFALIIGPPLGLGMCFVLGGANGFLEFVNRSALKVQLTGTAYLYALAAAVFFILMMLIPAISASRKTILTHKQQVARAHKRPLWNKLFLDIILLAVSLYGLYSYYNQKDFMAQISVAAASSANEPLMLLISTLFILGAGLLFLRIYPYIIKLIFLIGRRFWSPVFYLSLTQVSRSGGSEQFLMLFLVFTIGVSIFSANTARTINTNQVETLQYMDGADIVIKNEWKFDYAYYNVQKPHGFTVYKEVSYKPYQELETVKQATRVWRGEIRNAWANRPIFLDTPIALMAIEPSEFAETAQMRNHLTPYHWYNYANLLTDYKNTVLLSSEFKEYGVNVGDQVQVVVGDDAYIPVVVGSFIDYWPGIDPNDTTGTGEGSHYFAVVAFDTIFKDEGDDPVPIQPYEIWIKKADGVTSNQVYTEIGEKNLQIDERRDLTEDTVTLKNDPTLQSMNGALTLCFITSLIVCFAGFLIYWIISINRRVLQFGIIRAIGMKVRSLIGMLILEQGMISGSAILAGVLIGVLASYYYIPIYSMTQSAESLKLPFRIVSETGDYIRLYVILGVILLVGCLILAHLIRKIKINNALKIGED